MTEELKWKIEELLVFEGPHVLEGWCTAERGLEMAQLILDTKPETVVEIGVFGGRSLVVQALALRENGKGKIYGIDPWKLAPALEGETDPEDKKWWSNVNLNEIHEKAMHEIWVNELDEYAIIIRAASQHVPRLFAGGIDILFIDGNHSEVASCRDVELYMPMLNEGGYIFMDDCDWLETKKAQDMILERCNLIRTDGHLSLFQRKPEIRCRKFNEFGLVS